VLELPVYNNYYNHNPKDLISEDGTQSHLRIFHLEYLINVDGTTLLRHCWDANEADHPPGSQNNFRLTSKEPAHILSIVFQSSHYFLIKNEDFILHHQSLPYTTLVWSHSPWHVVMNHSFLSKEFEYASSMNESTAYVSFLHKNHRFEFPRSICCSSCSSCSSSPT